MKKLLFFLFLLPAGSFAQQATIASVAADFRQVNQAYFQCQRLQVDMNYTLYSSYTSTVAFQSDHGVYMKQGNSTCSNLFGIVSLSNTSLSLTLDSNEQTIVVTDPPQKKDRNPSLVNLDSLLGICSSVESKDAGGGIRLYKLKFERTPFFEYNAIDVYINESTHFLDRFILYFRVEIDLDENDGSVLKEKPRLEIRYSNLSTSPVFSADQFSESRFIRGTGKKITCASSYSHFRLINNKLH